VCRQLGRRFVLVDENPAAIEVMRKRLADASPDVLTAGPGSADLTLLPARAVP
jgi:site-specific DNA-methyltransferase (adenine-specific)